MKLFTESELHETIAELLDWILLPPAVWTTFPAGWGELTKKTAGRLKGCGLKAGMPDILVFYGGRTIGLELKLPGAKQNKAQEEMFPKLHAAGVQVYICRSDEDVKNFLRKEKVPIRGTARAA